MQYLLTKDEMENLVPLYQLVKAREALDVAREIISGKTVDDCMRGYCDQCPVSAIGGQDGEERPEDVISREICKLSRRYHK